MIHTLSRSILVLVLLTASLVASALDIPSGTIYFDNSLTKYTHPKFVYGDQERTYILSLIQDNGALWKVTIPNAVPNMYRYTFADTSLPDGTREEGFSDTKEYISKTLNEYRTATTDATIVVGWIYTPTSSDNWTSGSWQTKTQGQAYSGTLPVLFIDTQNGVSVSSKTDYVEGTFYLDNMGLEDYESIGSADEPLALSIRGRGNYTWTGFDKKPYRLKLAEKAPLMGLHKNRNFALMAAADDNLAFLRNTVGYEVSRRLGLAWTPSQEPVELVLNGNYLGLYMLTETVRLGNHRVDINEQTDGCEDPDSITGGWLVEIDNYSSSTDPQIYLDELDSNHERIMITGHSPKVWSNAQRAYITEQMTRLNQAIYASSKNSTEWENLIDMDELARFYICQEVMDDEESFHGSCFLYKEMDNSLEPHVKWMFGPVWDFGNAFNNNGGYCQRFVWDGPQFHQTWIGELYRFPRFQSRVKELWQSFRGDEFDSLSDYIADFIQHIATAAAYDARKWPSYGHSDVNSCKNTFISRLESRASWLVSQWGEGVSGIDDSVGGERHLWVASNGREISVEGDQPIATLNLYSTTGHCLATLRPNERMARLAVTQPGLYIVSATLENGVKETCKLRIR